MELLNNHQTQQISGGFDPVIMVLGTGCLVNFALCIVNFAAISNLNSTMQSISNRHDLAFLALLYHEAQLSLLPNYDVVSTMSIDEAYNLLY